MTSQWCKQTHFICKHRLNMMESYFGESQKKKKKKKKKHPEKKNRIISLQTGRFIWGYLFYLTAWYSDYMLTVSINFYAL